MVRVLTRKWEILIICKNYVQTGRESRSDVVNSLLLYTVYKWLLVVKYEWIVNYW